MKKIKLFFVAAAIFMGTLLVGCTNNTSKAFTSDRDLLAFYSLTSANILTDSSNQLVIPEINNNETTPEVVETSSMINVNEYLTMIEAMFVEEKPLVMNDESSDLSEYEFKVIFEARDLTGKKSNYVIYYNQIEITEKDDDIFEEEKEYRLEGVAVIEGVNYQIKGEKELEGRETSLDITIKLDSQNYVVIEQEIDNNEQEYEYEVYKDGKKYTSISFEVINGKTFEVEFMVRDNGYLEKYHFYKVGSEVRIKYQSPSKVFTITATTTINPNTNETIYDYKVTETNQEFQFKK